MGIKKVMGVAYIPEDLTGKYTCLSTMNQRDQTKFLESDIFSMSGDSWMKEPGAVEWSAGKGVFINNYSNFILWVGLDDQLRFVSLAKGTDLKYVLLRLQKAVSRIEEALTRSVEALDNLYAMDKNLQAKFGIKTSQTG